MGTYKTKDVQADLGLRLFWHNRVYSEILRHNQVYSEIIQAYSGIFRTLCNHGMLRTLTYLEPQTCSKP